MQQVEKVEKLKTGCIFALLALLALDAMAATDSDVYRLKSEVSQLRSQVRSLERQVRQLEEQMRQVRDRQPILANKMSTSPWHQLRVGMSKDQVTSLLGEPTEEDAGAGVDVGKDVWQYTERGHVEFDAAGRVSRWKAP
ncbi:MAG: outer membrane protein assembly factor BamE [Gammaproteobacteria bacterium]|nr:outer membrane protein assembly factor BamE [Gammaproteobacteria bacterium]